MEVKGAVPMEKYCMGILQLQNNTTQVEVCLYELCSQEKNIYATFITVYPCCIQQYVTDGRIIRGVSIVLLYFSPLLTHNCYSVIHEYLIMPCCDTKCMQVLNIVYQFSFINTPNSVMLKAPSHAINLVLVRSC